MQTQLRQAVVVAFGRTPYCKARKGSFAQLHPVEYGAQTLLGVLARVPQLRPEDIGDVIMGCAMPFGVQGGNMARLIVQRAGLLQKEADFVSRNLHFLTITSSKLSSSVV